MQAYKTNQTHLTAVLVSGSVRCRPTQHNTGQRNIVSPRQSRFTTTTTTTTTPVPLAAVKPFEPTATSWPCPLVILPHHSLCSKPPFCQLLCQCIGICNSIYAAGEQTATTPESLAASALYEQQLVQQEHVTGGAAPVAGSVKQSAENTVGVHAPPSIEHIESRLPDRSFSCSDRYSGNSNRRHTVRYG
jgi:hypothetical protein